MTKKIRLASLTSEWVGTPYEEYCERPKEGCDCLSFILNMLESYGHTIPDEFEGLNRYNYMASWHANKDKTIEKLHRFLLSVTEEKELNRMRSGDIILVKNRKVDERGFMMYAGNNKVIMVSIKFGVVTIPMREVKILKVYKGFH